MTTSTKPVDRRIQRTRQLLQQAFLDISREKSFATLTVQDITERANVNRGTFYAHFADKYALLDAIIRDGFQQRLASQLPPVAMWNRQTLQKLIQLILEYTKELHSQCHLPNVNLPMIERATHEEVAALLVAWLKQGQAPDAQWTVPVETMARVASWAIFGAAACWSSSPQGAPTAQSAEQMAHDVLLVIMEGVERLLPRSEA